MTLLRWSSFAGSVAFLGAVAALLVSAAATGHAATVRALSLAELVAKADVIVVGTPERAQSRRSKSGRLLVTDVAVRVERVLEGTAIPGQHLSVTLLGGEVDGVALSVPGEASLALGQRALLFLYATPRSRELRVVGMAQGALPLSPQPDGTLMVLPASGADGLVERGTTGQLQAAQPAVVTPEPAETLLSRVQQLVAAQAPR